MTWGVWQLVSRHMWIGQGTEGLMWSMQAVDETLPLFVLHSIHHAAAVAAQVLPSPPPHPI